MLDPTTALAQINKPIASAPSHGSTLLIAGAAGALGNELVNHLSASSHFKHTLLLARTAFAHMPPRVDALLAGEPSDWAKAFAAQRIDVVVAGFEPARSFYEREAALLVPTPEQLPALARAARAAGAHTLAVVLPHRAGSLPNALKAALAGFDEMALNDMAFDRLLVVRATSPRATASGSLGNQLAHWMLGVAKYMLPKAEQPVRAAKVAQFVAAALDVLLREQRVGVFVAPPEVVWHAAQAKTDGPTLAEVVRRWLDAPA